MISVKHKLKINNSYESEPSSGSGSSLSEQLEGPVSDDENIHFPYLMKPTIITNYDHEDTQKLQNVKCTNPSTVSANTSFKEDEAEEKITQKERQLQFSRPAHSSQESPFEGFNESPFGSLREQIYNIEHKSLKVPSQYNVQGPSPGKITFPKFYDTIVEENSCNAVDMQLSNESVITPRRSICSNSLEINLSTDLSFNGKIKNLRKPIQNAQIHNEQVKLEKQPEARSEQSMLSNSVTLNDHTASLDTSHTSQLTESFILKKYSNERSPDLFGDDEEEDDEDNAEKSIQIPTKEFIRLEDIAETKESLDACNNRSLNCPTENSFVDDQTLDLQSSVDDNVSLFRNSCRRERELLRRTRKCLAGIPPPPSLTILQLDMFDSVLSKKTEILNYLNDLNTDNSSSCIAKQTTSLFKPTHTVEEAKNMGWRDILGVRQMGLSFNLNKASESNEYLSLAVIERFIGAETTSSYRNSPTSAKKRSCRLKLLTQSPGNRLSHLAKRRAIFSSANLATTSLKSTSSFGPQLLFDKKKLKNRRKSTPKRMTPGSKKKNRKTPSSSARKRLFRSDLLKPGPSRETSKRALFQSPAKQQLQQKYAPTKPVIKPEIANRVEKSKRALFSPETKQTELTTRASSTTTKTTATMQYAPIISPKLESLLKRKRHYVEDEELASQSSKLFRSSGENLTPRALKIKSQSFCIGAGSSTTANPTTSVNATITGANFNQNFGMNSSISQSFANSNANSFTNVFGSKLNRAHSDMAAPVNNLTENQRKKLLWAVSQALQEKKITAKHESFKQYASILARVVRRIFSEYYQKTSTSNSETMLRLAKKYAYQVISGKNLDDIYLHAKTHIDDSKRQSGTRLSGYIGPEEYEQPKLSQQLVQTQSSSHYGGSMQNLFATESSIDSFNLSISQTSSTFCASSAATLSLVQSQASLLERLSQDMPMTQNLLTKSVSKQQPIQVNSSLQNSSSKSNLGGSALRENVDCEQRRSAQKNFTGKDQRNVSPYAGVSTTSGGLARGLLGSGRKLQSDFLPELPAGGGKVKRQITFDS